MALDLTTMDAALKEYYTPEAIEDMVYKDNPLIALMPKFEDMRGRYMDVPVIYGNPQGRSATFSRAITRGAVTASAIKRFLITRVKNYSVATIDNETILASENDKGAFLEALTLEMDGALNSLTRDLAGGVYRSGYGDRGTISTSSFAVTTLTLTNRADIVNFEVGMELVVSASVSSNTLKALGSSGNGLIVTGVNRSAGTLSFGFNVNDATNGIPTIAQNDVLFVRGDREDSATPTRLKAAGLEAWMPAAGVTSTPFFGMDRTSDASRLGGLSYDGSAAPIEEALIEGASRAAENGGKVDHAFMNYANYSSLEKALGSKVNYIDLSTGRIAFRGIRVNGPRGEINVVPDQNCPAQRCYMLQLDTWKYGSMGKLVRVVDTDGLETLRQSTADGVEYRAASYSNVYCKAPGYNINVQLAN